TIGRHVAELESQPGAVLFERTGRGLLPPSLVTKRIAKVTLGAYAHRDYLRRRGTPKEMKDLLSHEMVGGDKDEALLRGFASFGFPVEREAFAFRTDDLVAYWEAVRAGLGVGFVADYLARRDNQLVAILPMIKIPPLPIWLTVHRELRTSRRIRAVYDFLAAAVPKAF
ncbi:MAG: LysR substrate-binding domain-containing protein, partial [Ramlibacter sp.]